METDVKRKIVTSEEYEKLPEGSPYQLINGELIMSPATKDNHQAILIELAAGIFLHVKEKLLGSIRTAPYDVHFDEENIFQPDIIFLSNENLKNVLDDGYFHGVPELVIEILSTGTANYDLTKKMHVYEHFGVREYFVIHPVDKEVHCYRLQEHKFKEAYIESGIIRSEVLQAEFVF